MSKLPFLISLSFFSSFLFLFLSFLKVSVSWSLLLSGLVVSMIWSRDLFRELSSGQSLSLSVPSGKLLMILFIFSEVLFFFSFFWTYLEMSLSSDFFLGGQWPPYCVLSMKSFKLPLLNTFLLLTSSFFLTLFHEYFILGVNFFIYYIMGVFLGAYFLSLQVLEYKGASFSLGDSVEGSMFFMFTGFHGLHVFGGGVFLVLVLSMLKVLNMNQTLVLDVSIWYWHFVDVVWLFLFSILYWWSF